MSHRQFNLNLVVLLAGAALVLVPFPVHSQARDLDDDYFTDERLRYDLDQEFSDLNQYNDSIVPLQTLFNRMWTDLTDNVHYGHTDELTFEELDAEMREAGTTLQAVLSQALAEADMDASLQQQRAWTTDRFESSEDSPFLRVLDPAVGPIAQRRPKDGNVHVGSARQRFENKFIEFSNSY